MKVIINFLRLLYHVENRAVRRFRSKTFIALFALSLTSCTHKPSKFVGYVVCMEYYPQRMSNEAESVEQYAGFAPHITPHVFIRPAAHPRPPHIIEAKYIIYVANKYEVKSFDVDSVQFNSIELGQKVVKTED